MNEYVKEDRRNSAKKAFAVLRRNGIYARFSMNICCATCASYECGTKVEANDKYYAAAFFIKSDEDAGAIFISYFNQDDNTDEKNAEVGKIVFETLQNAGVTVKWDGNPNKTIKMSFDAWKHSTDHLPWNRS